MTPWLKGARTPLVKSMSWEKEEEDMEVPKILAVDANLRPGCRPARRPFTAAFVSSGFVTASR